MAQLVRADASDPRSATGARAPDALGCGTALGKKIFKIALAVETYSQIPFAETGSQLGDWGPVIEP